MPAQPHPLKLSFFNRDPRKVARALLGKLLVRKTPGGILSGNYYCLNVSCLPDGIPGGVLFRALEPVSGIEAMAAARRIKVRKPDDLIKPSWVRQIASGPGRLCQAFGITRDRDNGKNFTSPRSDLRILDDGYRTSKIIATPRIGITKAAADPLRYVIAGNPFVSGPGKI